MGSLGAMAPPGSAPSSYFCGSPDGGHIEARHQSTGGVSNFQLAALAVRHRVAVLPDLLFVGRFRLSQTASTPPGHPDRWPSSSSYQIMGGGP